MGNCPPVACDVRYSCGSGSEPNPRKDQGGRQDRLGLPGGVYSIRLPGGRSQTDGPLARTMFRGSRQDQIRIEAPGAGDRVRRGGCIQPHSILQNGTIDVECGSTTNTAERQKQVSFSIATYVASPRWLVSASSAITELSELEGQTIVVTQGSLESRGSPEDHHGPEAECEDHSGQGPRRNPS